MSRARDTLQSGLLQGRLPGMKEWRQFYLTLTATELHIYDGLDYGEPAGQHLRSLQIHSSDIAGVDSKAKKENRFYILRVDGRYIFKCPHAQEREEWINQLQRVINKQSLERMPDFKVPSPDEFDPDNLRHSPLSPRRVDIPQPPSSKSKTLPAGKRSKSVSTKISSVLDTPLPPPPDEPFDSPRASIVSNDSGIGVSGGGEIHMPPNKRPGSSSVPSSGDAQFGRRAYGAGSSKSDGGKFGRNQIQVDDSPGEFSYEKCKWYWGCMSRTDCEDKLRSEGAIGNFVVRMNANGHYVMSLWRANGVHHHKIIHYDNIFRFERSQVNSEGESLVDLLDTYMKNTKDKGIKPFGGQLYDQYTYAWNPPDFDMLLLQERLKEQKKKREMAKTPPSKKRNQYTPVELDLGKATDSESSGDTTITKKKSPPPKPPVKPAKPSAGDSSSLTRGPAAADKERSESPREKMNRFKIASPERGLETNSGETQPSVSPSITHVKRTQPSQPKPNPGGGQALISEMIKKRNTQKDSTPPATASKPKKQPIPLPKPKPNRSTPSQPTTTTTTEQQPPQTESTPSPPPAGEPQQEPAYSNWDYGKSGADTAKSKPYQNWTSDSAPPPSTGKPPSTGNKFKRYQNVTSTLAPATATPPTGRVHQEQRQVAQHQQPQEETVYMNLQGPAVKSSRARHRARQQQQQQTSAAHNGHGQAGSQVSEYQNIGKGYR